MEIKIAFAHLIHLGEELVPYETVLAYQGKLVEIFYKEELITLPSTDSIWCDLKAIAPKRSFSTHWDTGGLFSPEGEYVSGSEWITLWDINLDSIEWQSGNLFTDFFQLCEQEKAEKIQWQEIKESQEAIAKAIKDARLTSFNAKVDFMIQEFFEGKDMETLKSLYYHGFSTSETHLQKCKNNLHLAGVKFFWKESFKFKSTNWHPESSDGMRSSGVSESWETAHMYQSISGEKYKDMSGSGKKEFIIPYPSKEEYAKYLAKRIRRWAEKLVKDGYSNPSPKNVHGSPRL